MNSYVNRTYAAEALKYTIPCNWGEDTQIKSHILHS